VGYLCHSATPFAMGIRGVPRSKQERLVVLRDLVHPVFRQGAEIPTTLIHVHPGFLTRELEFRR